MNSINYIRKTITILGTNLRKNLNLSDYRRWSRRSSLSSKWDVRTEKIGRLVPCESTVIEFGAGRIVLPQYLPEGCKYTPSDICDRGHGTIVCDLNQKELPSSIKRYDVAVFSGVLEYVSDVPRLIKKLSPMVDCIVASYAVKEYTPIKSTRRVNGWVNDYSQKLVVRIFETEGYICDHIELWNRQCIFRFIK